MPRTGIAKVVKVKKVRPTQPSAADIASKKGGANTISEPSDAGGKKGGPSASQIASKKGGGYTDTGSTKPTKPPAGGKEEVLHGTTSGSGVKLNTNAGSPGSPGGKKGNTRKTNAEQFGFNVKPVRRTGGGGGGITRGGGDGTGGGGGGGGSIGDRFGGGRRDTGLEGASDGGRLAGAFRDRNIVGSQNDVEEFDGSSFSGGGYDEAGGGGGSGSALAGRESVGLARVRQGESVEDVVYGVKKRSRRVSRARGE